MINLLPPTARKNIIYMYWLRVATVWLVLCTFALFVAAFTMLPTYVLIGSQVETYRASANEAALVVEDYQETSAQLLAANQKASQILTVTNQTSVLQILNTALDEVGDGIAIDSIEVSARDEGFAPVRIMGEADTRQQLAAFSNRLEALEMVEDVELPISNLAQDRDISFSLSVLINTNTL